MSPDLDVILVSNRGPVSFVPTEDGFEITRGAGGLAGALHSVVKRLGSGAVWIAAATSDEDRAAIAAGADKGLAAELGYPVHFLDIDPDAYSRYYDVVSNRLLWFANHCLMQELQMEEFGDAELIAWNEAYDPINEKFARAAAELAGRSSLVLFQDYHLATAPGHLRAARPDSMILHFTHSSFCGPRDFERMPRPIPQKTIEGMLGADLLGFHVPPWVSGFLDCCDRVGATVDRAAGTVDHKGHRTWVRAYPIPIDAGSLRAKAQSAEVGEWATRFGGMAPGRLIVRADRTDPSKNIVRGFEAFGALLDRRPDLAGNTAFVACLYPSRQTMAEYRAYSDDIHHAVERVNARHPGSVELFVEDDFNRTLGALLVYDVLLVNPIMDGMNLVSKEGPALNRNDGILVLSRGAGSFTELGSHAVEIADPLDVEATARAMEAALEMAPHERKKRADRLRREVVASDPGGWIQQQIEDLVSLRDGGEPATAPA